VGIAFQYGLGIVKPPSESPVPRSVWPFAEPRLRYSSSFGERGRRTVHGVDTSFYRR
jgi:hypothetical protein